MLLLALTAAFGQDLNADGVNSQLYVPPIDSKRTLWVEDSQVDAGTPSFRASSATPTGPSSTCPPAPVRPPSWSATSSRPTSRPATPSAPCGLAWTCRVYLFSAGQVADGGFGLGDIRLDLKAWPSTAATAPLGSASPVA